MLQLNNKNYNFKLSVFLGIALCLLALSPASNAQNITLGTASDYGVLAGSGITNTGATSITGDVGSYPGTSITGFGTVVINGTDQGGDSLTQQAKIDLSSAYTDAASRTPTTTYAPAFDLGGLTLSAGVYNDPTSLNLTGVLTLDAHGDPNAVWIFQAGSSLTTANGSTIVLTGGATAASIFWQVGSSATLGTSSNFSGNILAFSSITLDTGATLNGSALAETGLVSLDHNVVVVAVPEPVTTTLLYLGLATLILIYRRGFCQSAMLRRA